MILFGRDRQLECYMDGEPSGVDIKKPLQPPPIKIPNPKGPVDQFLI